MRFVQLKADNFFSSLQVTVKEAGLPNCFRPLKLPSAEPLIATHSSGHLIISSRSLTKRVTQFRATNSSRPLHVTVSSSSKSMAHTVHSCQSVASFPPIAAGQWANSQLHSRSMTPKRNFPLHSDLRTGVYFKESVNTQQTFQCDACM